MVQQWLGKKQLTDEDNLQQTATLTSAGQIKNDIEKILSSSKLKTKNYLITPFQTKFYTVEECTTQVMCLW